ncbi:MAG: hypothetical protein IT446_11205 [Phycisphaerales bacterium]|nr:hypothetical protein [Phycisphaerales bacterium]
MRRFGFFTMAAISAAAMMAPLSGCQDNSPPPPRVPVPAAGNPDAPLRPRNPQRPVDTNSADSNAGRMYQDVPLVNERPPEQQAFVDAYNRVGRPRIILFVNRTLDGQIIPVNPNDPVARLERRRRSTTGVSVERGEETHEYGPYGERHTERHDDYSSAGPGEYSEQTELYLQPGQYDEAMAKSLDYEAMENILTDWIAADGQVMVISPIMARQRLTDQQVKDLQSGRPRVLAELAQELNADILIQVQAHPTRQTRQGLEIRIIAEAINIKGGQSIGRAVVDLLPPLEKTTINKYTRFLARKLMDGMTGTWASFAAPPAPPAPPVAPPPPSTQPIGPLPQLDGPTTPDR